MYSKQYLDVQIANLISSMREQAGRVLPASTRSSLSASNYHYEMRISLAVLMFCLECGRQHLFRLNRTCADEHRCVISVERQSVGVVISVEQLLATDVCGSCRPPLLCSVAVVIRSRRDERCKQEPRDEISRNRFLVKHTHVDPLLRVSIPACMRSLCVCKKELTLAFVAHSHERNCQRGETHVEVLLVYTIVL